MVRTSLEPAVTAVETTSPRQRLAEVAVVFLRLGVIAFGGPAAHIAMMEDETVRRRAWLSREQFLDLLGAAQLVPGPGSTKLAMHLGYRRAGPAGLVAAGVCFILPAMLMVMGIAAAYQSADGVPAFARTLDAVLYGVKPVVIAVVAQALVVLGRSALKSRSLIVLGVVAAVGNFFIGHDLAVLFGAGVVVALARRPAAGRTPLALLPLPLFGTATTTLSFGAMCLLFLKTGGLVYGSGYVLLPLLHADFVADRGWLTEAQLLDAVAVGQVTPGPVFTTATFIGYLLGPEVGVGGPVGAVAATVAIFLPAFVLVAVSGPLVPRLRRSPDFAAFLDGVNVGSLALLAVVLGKHLAPAALVDAPTVVEALCCTVLLVRFRVNSIWPILAGVGFGLVRAFATF